jgi:hypothetical protein
VASSLPIDLINLVEGSGFRLLFLRFLVLGFRGLHADLEHNGAEVDAHANSGRLGGKRDLITW